ncbi:MAG TPA: Gfo/Idh/MocA family oxidoreductase [Lacipirellulaceae bacterium]|nr:Gfo/Idh/MocA family oxidoreductase [Lacipirellulaceae bacterium]HMP06060.1 Gfo/Idh/MocA family oxidoreductase [Lacipirellulaceae bacterium]
MNRRNFLTNATTVIGAASVARAAGTSSTNAIRLGFIGVGGRGHALLLAAIKASRSDRPIQIVSVCDVFDEHRHSAAHVVERGLGKVPHSTVEYRDLLNDESLDAVCIATPDHWHARMTLDALKAGKHVYCEKPMTRTIAEAAEVYRSWVGSDLVVQIGVQCTQLPVWAKVNEWIRAGQFGKIMQYQTEFFRNSTTGQWRNYSMRPTMTPQAIDWDRFLGLEFDLAPEMPFDREYFAQWRRYWHFGSGMFTDLFVHRITAMLAATGLRFPARVVGAGGIFLELDGRQVPDVGTVVVDYNEGVQGIVTATMAAEATPLQQLIRGHHGAAVFGNGEDFTGFDYVVERPQVTLDASLANQRVEVGGVSDTTQSHMENFLDAIFRSDPAAVACTPELGAAALITTCLGARSYREGRVFHFDQEALRAHDGDGSWAAKWEAMSQSRVSPPQVPGWSAGESGSKLFPPPDTGLAGPWLDGKEPTKR